MEDPTLDQSVEQASRNVNQNISGADGVFEDEEEKKYLDPRSA